MTSTCQIRGVLSSSAALLIVAAVCFHFDSVKGNCNEVLTESFGEFQSPGYPDLQDNTHCTWKITAPEHHIIIITFVDVALTEVFFCNDEVTIYEGDVKIGTYTGTQVPQQSITSSKNTITVVLMSCSNSFAFVRRGIRVSYATVDVTGYLTTSPHQTIQRGSTTALALMKVKQTRSSKAFLYTILGGLLPLILVSIIVVAIIIKRRNYTTSLSGNMENSAKGYFTRIVTGRAVAGSLNHSYLDVNETQKEEESVYYSRGRISTNTSAPTLQKKLSHFCTDNNDYVYEDYGKSIQNVEGNHEDYSREIYRI